ncbi:hypothetical protein BN946_scf184911.g84 [Trametes cinnabarina]|uniref:REJ domain-containing protein n=1 Tax=Pycnoporus cinnabarinus TaxID=5643 RepID=A0A060SH93_PYCCI|nr:hypothetical protein BN946_scf184911.g84 [Trametes cinnabarina]
MSSFNVTGPPMGVFTSSAAVSNVDSLSVLSPSSAPLLSSSVVAERLSAATSSSVFTAQVRSSTFPSFASALSSPSHSESAVSRSSEANASRFPIGSSFADFSSTAAFSSASVSQRTIPVDIPPGPFPVPPTATQSTPIRGTSSASSVHTQSSVVAPSSATPPSSISLPTVVTSPVPPPHIPPDQSVPPAASKASTSQAASSSGPHIIKPLETPMAQTGTSVRMAIQQSTAAAQTSDGSAPATASQSASPSPSEATSVAPVKTDDGHDPAPPAQSSTDSKTSATSTPSSVPSRPSTASTEPTQSPGTPPSAPAPASNSPHSAAAETSAPSASSPTPAAPLDSTEPTSLHAVSSHSFSPATTTLDNTPSLLFIPPRVTKADPVDHSAAVASPSLQPTEMSDGSAGASIHTSESQPVLTPLVQNDISDHASAAAPTAPASSVGAQHKASEVHATPIAASAVPVSSAASASSDDSSENESGLVQANKQSAAPTSTSTVTDKPETTLSSPVFETVTDANDHTSLTLPPVFTSVQVSQLPDGGEVSITHVIANPTGIYGVQAESSSHGFMSHSGAVAGVFLAIGIVIAAIALGICLFLRRRRRRNPRFIATISRPLPMPDNPFEDPRDLSPPPQMRYASGYTDRTLIIDGQGRAPPRSPFDDSMAAPAPPAPTPTRSSSRGSSSRYNGLGLAGIGAHGRFGSMGSAETATSEMRLHTHTVHAFPSSRVYLRLVSRIHLEGATVPSDTPLHLFHDDSSTTIRMNNPIYPTAFARSTQSQSAIDLHSRVTF